MKLKFYIMAVIFCCCHLFSFSQNRNSVWCFGDSAGINFNNIANPTPITTGLRTRGSCASIADTTGSLLFYANTRATIPGNTTLVYDNTNIIMQNGDSIVGRGWYQELAIAPIPNNTSSYYVFTLGVTSIFGFYYSIVDMSQNGGLGGVTQKNVQLENFKIVDGMRTIKHGNGRDWWVALRNATNYGNEHYLYLVTPSGISPAFIQPIGSANNTNAGRYAFSQDGSKLAFINYIGLMEIYDFDRCTGIISNPFTIHPEPATAPYGHFWSAEFSPNNRFLYVTAYADTCYLYQYDLLSPNPALSRITLDTISNYLIGIGNLKLAPDNKIYLSNMWECPWSICYPYPDSVYNSVNMHLSVINFPDSLDTACGYAPYSFYLGGKRTYYGLPNNPDYDMPRDSGSVCDTIQYTGIQSPPATAGGVLYVTYVSSWDKLFINAQNLNGKKYTLRVYDLLGNLIFKENGKLTPPYFTKDLNCTALAHGMYIVTFQTERERLVKKFIKQ